MLILASGSTRRRQILDLFEVAYSIEEPLIEEVISPGEDPAEAVQRLAEEKGASVLAVNSGSSVLSADTVVSVDDRILEKPVDHEDARAMLEALSGRWHCVFTGIALQGLDGRRLIDCAEARVRFRSLSPFDIDAYLASGEPFGKAGGYAVQGLGGSLVQHVEGELSTVVGLTISVTARFLTAFGIDHSLNRDQGSGHRSV